MILMTFFRMPKAFFPKNVLAHKPKQTKETRKRITFKSAQNSPIEQWTCRWWHKWFLGELPKICPKTDKFMKQFKTMFCAKLKHDQRSMIIFIIHRLLLYASVSFSLVFRWCCGSKWNRSIQTVTVAAAAAHDNDDEIVHDAHEFRLNSTPPTLPPK